MGGLGEARGIFLDSQYFLSLPFTVTAKEDRGGVGVGAERRGGGWVGGRVGRGGLHWQQAI